MTTGPTARVLAVIFDMDGVLCDSEPFICQAACRMFERVHGVKVLPADFLPFVGTGENRYLGGVAEKYDIPLRLPEDKTTTYDIYLEVIRGRLKPLPGVNAFVAHCRRAGLKLAVATSADTRKMDGNLNELGIPHTVFDTCVTGDMITHKKPHPEIFLTAAARLALPPENCLVVEDAVSGVTAARAAGMSCLGITSSFTSAELVAAGAQDTADNLAAYLTAGVPLLPR